MKKLFLLLAAGSIAASLNAQEMTHSSVLFTTPGQVIDGRAVVTPSVNRAELRHFTNAKTTAGPGSRWYNYGDYFDTSLGSVNVSSSAPYLWNDTMSQDIYSGATPLGHNTMVSVGNVLQPNAPGFNDPSYYGGEMQITGADAYKVDSVTVFGFYGLNPAKSSVVDTLKFVITYGGAAGDFLFSNFTDATLLGHYGLPTTDSLEFALLRYDSVKNTSTGTSSIAFTQLLNSSVYGDTTASGLWIKTIAVPGGGLNVPAGNMVGMSITFKSGDAAFVPHDTVFTGHTPGLYRYNMFRPLVLFKGSSSAAAYAPYSHSDWNEGLFKNLPNFKNGWENVYIPMWAWGVSSASTLQHVYTAFHAVCAACGSVSVPTVKNALNSINVYPNPAENEVNVAYTLSTAANVTVTLSNAVGQVVASKNMGDNTRANAVFNTTSLPAGVYFYTLTANGERTTGNVVVAH